jgi:hypothetical protein
MQRRTVVVPFSDLLTSDEDIPATKPASSQRQNEQGNEASLQSRVKFPQGAE